MLKKAVKILFSSLLAIAITAVVALVVLLYTPVGVNLVHAQLSNYVPNLSIGRAEGALFKRVQLHDFSFRDEQQGVDVSLEQFNFALNPACFTEPSICIYQVHLQGLTAEINLKETESSETTTSEVDGQSDSPVNITTPVAIKINEFSVDDANILFQDQQIKWEKLTTSLSFQGNRLHIRDVDWLSPHIKLAESHIPPEPSSLNEDSTQTAVQPISLPEIHLPIQLRVDRFAVQDFQLAEQPDASIERLELTLMAAKQKINISKLELNGPAASANLQAEIALKGEYPLELSVKGEVYKAPITGQKFALQASGSLAKLNLVASLEQVLTSTIRAQLRPLQLPVQFDVSLSQTQLFWPLEGEPQHKLNVATLNLKGDQHQFALRTKGTVNSELAPETDFFVSGQGSLFDFDASAFELATLGGELSGTASVDWRSGLKWDAKLNLASIQPGLFWPQAEGEISGALSTSGTITEDQTWAVELSSLDIEGILREYPLNLNGTLSAKGHQDGSELVVETQGLQLAHGDNQIEVIGNARQNLDLTVSIQVPDLSHSLPGSTGEITGEVQVTGTQSDPKVALDLGVKRLAWQELLSVHSGSLKGTLEPLGELSADLKLRLTGIQNEQQKIDSVLMALRGSEAKHSANFNLQSPLAQLATELSGELKRADDLTWHGHLNNTVLTTEQGTWSLVDKLGVSFASPNNQLRVSTHCWRQADSSLCLNKPITTGDKIEADVSLTNFAFAQIAQYIPEQLAIQGAANIDSQVTWQAESPLSANLDLELSPGSLTSSAGAAPVTLNWQSITASTNLQNNELSAEAYLDVIDNGDIKAALKIPDVTTENKQLDAHLQTEDIHLGFLAPLLNEYSELASLLNLNVKLSGSVDHPKVTGDLVAKDIQVKGEITPIDIDSGEIAIEFTGYKASLDANIQTPDGLLEVDGKADWQDINNWRTTARVFAEELQVKMPPLVKMKVVPDMSIDVVPGTATIAGDISLPWGRIVVEELPESAVKVSRDQVILDETLTPVAEQAPIPFDVQTNVNINIGDDFKVFAFGLEGDLRGKLNVARRDQAPFVTGEVNIVNGEYRSFGQDLLIKDGKVLMNGPVDQPFVDIKAIRNPDNTQDGVIAGVAVTGLADDPQMTIFSEPAMPQANALSYLLRGQNLDASSKGGGMTTALIGLSLAKSGKLVGQLGEAFGVQDLKLDTAGSGDSSQVTVSGYVMPGLQVKYGVGIFDSVGEFTVRYQLMQDLYIQAVSGLDSAVDLLYHFEIE